MQMNSSKNKSLVSLSLVIAFISLFFYAYEDGITGKTLKSSEPGCTCHSETQSSQVNVSIEGPDVLSPGETATYLIRITGGPLTRGGTNIAASSGVLQPGNGLQKIGSELTHTMPKEPQSGEVIFEFNYTAPALQGMITIYANGNSVNFSGTEFGDSWNFAENKIVNVEAIADINDPISEHAYYLEQNYPNPFNPSTNIMFSLKQSEYVSLAVYDMLGNIVKILIDDLKSAGTYNVNFIGDGLSSGIYYYTLKTENFTSTKKMLLVK